MILKTQLNFVQLEGKYQKLIGKESNVNVCEAVAAKTD